MEINHELDSLPRPKQNLSSQEYDMDINTALESLSRPKQNLSSQEYDMDLNTVLESLPRPKKVLSYQDYDMHLNQALETRQIEDDSGISRPLSRDSTTGTLVEEDIGFDINRELAERLNAIDPTGEAKSGSFVELAKKVRIT
jgi:hypothetical protein